LKRVLLRRKTLLFAIELKARVIPLVLCERMRF